MINKIFFKFGIYLTVVIFLGQEKLYRCTLMYTNGELNAVK